MEEMKKCPYCGELIKSEAKKCKYCGEWLQEQNDDHTPLRNYKVKNAPSDSVNDNTMVAMEKEKPGFFEYYLYDVFIKHFADFKGEISRKQYWISTFLFWGLILICGFLAISTQLAVLSLLPSLIFLGGIVPYIAMDVRRLRDCGISGLWILLFLLTPLMLWAMFGKGEAKAMPVKWQKADSIIGGIVGFLLVIGIISSCLGNASYDEEIIPAAIELSEDNPYNLPNTAIEED